MKRVSSQWNHELCKFLRKKKDLIKKSDSLHSWIIGLLCKSYISVGSTHDCLKIETNISLFSFAVVSLSPAHGIFFVHL